MNRCMEDTALLIANEEHIGGCLHVTQLAPSGTFTQTVLSQLSLHRVIRGESDLYC